MSRIHQPPPDALQQALVLRVLVDRVLVDDGPATIPLTSRDWLRAVSQDAGLAMSRVRPAIEALDTHGIVTLVVGGGRTHPSTITLRQSAGAAVRQLLTAEPELERVGADLLADVDRLAACAPAQVSSLWWGPPAEAAANQILVAPIEYSAFAEQPLYGRADDIDRLAAEVVASDVVVLQGTPGRGKTHLAAHYVGSLVDAGSFGIELAWIKLTRDSVLDDIWRPLQAATMSVEGSSIVSAPPGSDAIRSEALLEQLRRRRVVVVLDDVHRALDERHRFRDPGLALLIRQVLDSGTRLSRVLLVGWYPPTDDRGRQPAMLKLDPLRHNALSQLMHDQGVPMNDELQRYLQRIDGNALAAQALAGLLRSTPEAGLPSDLGPVSSVIAGAVACLEQPAKLLLVLVALHDEQVPERLLRAFLLDTLRLSESAAGALIDDLHRTRGLLIGYWVDQGRIYSIAELVGCAALAEVSSEETMAVAGWAAEWWRSYLTDPDPNLHSAIMAVHLMLRAGDRRQAAELLREPVASLMLATGRLARLRRFLDQLFELDGTRASGARLDAWAERQELGTPALRELLRIFGVALHRLGELDEAIHYLGELRTAVPSDPEAANALACALLDAGRPEEALRLARSVVEQTQDDMVKVEALATIGSALDETGPADESLVAYEAANEIAVRLGDSRTQALVQARIGMLLWKLGRPDEAGKHFVDARALVPSDDPYLLGLVQGDLGHWYMDRRALPQDLDSAIDCYEKAIDLHAAAGVQRGCGFWKGQLGRAWGLKGKEQKAHGLLAEAVAIHLQVGDRAALGRHFHYLARHHRQFRARGLGLARAFAYYAISLETFDKSSAELERQVVAVEYDQWLGRLSDAQRRSAQDNGRAQVAAIRRVLQGNGELP